MVTTGMEGGSSSGDYSRDGIDGAEWPTEEGVGDRGKAKSKYTAQSETPKEAEEDYPWGKRIRREPLPQTYGSRRGQSCRHRR